MSESTINYRFTPQPIGSEKMETFIRVRQELLSVAVMMDRILPEGRYKSLCLTELENAAMWASKSITHYNEPKD